MNLLNASQIRFNGSDITLIKLDGTIVYEVKTEEPEENTNPYYIEYTVDNTSVQALNTSNNGYCYGLPKATITVAGYGTVSQIFQGSSREITLKDGTITTDASTTCDKIAKVKIWYPEEIHALKFTGVYTNPPVIKTLEYCNTSNFTDMSQMFEECSKITELDLSSFDTSKVTDMSMMFKYCESLASLNLSNWDTSKVTDMDYMFYGCNKLTTITCNNTATINKIASELPTRTADAPGTIITDCPKSDLDITTLSSKGWNVVSPYYIEYTVDNTSTQALNGGNDTYKYGLPRIYSSTTSYSFTGYEDIEITLLDGTITTDVTTTCDQVAKVKLWYPGNTVAISFYGSSSYKPVIKTVNYCNTSNFPDMSRMFYYCSNLTTIPNLDTSKVTNMSRMFYGCSKLTTIPNLDTSNVTNMSYMFDGCSKLTTIPNLDTSNVTNMQSMFYECNRLTTIPNLNTSNVTNMSSMFYYCSNLTTIPNLDTSNVTNMSSMFYYCQKLTTIPNLNTSNVTNMSSMFYYCSNLTTIPNLDTSNVTDMSNMFRSCSNLTTIPNLDTSNVTNMSYMFYGCNNLTTIPNLDTSNVTNMSSMFYYCQKLTTIPNLDTSNVTNMSSMFQYCSALTSLDLSNLDTSNVTNMSSMFYSCNNLTNLQAPKNISTAVDFSSCTNLTHDSLMSIINNLATVTSTKKLTLGSTNLAKLTDSEKAIATNKGWTLA